MAKLLLCSVANAGFWGNVDGQKRSQLGIQGRFSSETTWAAQGTVVQYPKRRTLGLSTTLFSGGLKPKDGQKPPGGGVREKSGSGVAERGEDDQRAPERPARQPAALLLRAHGRGLQGALKRGGPFHAQKTLCKPQLVHPSRQPLMVVVGKPSL